MDVAQNRHDEYVVYLFVVVHHLVAGQRLRDGKGRPCGAGGLREVWTHAIPHVVRSSAGVIVIAAAVTAVLRLPLFLLSSRRCRPAAPIRAAVRPRRRLRERRPYALLHVVVVVVSAAVRRPEVSPRHFDLVVPQALLKRCEALGRFVPVLPGRRRRRPVAEGHVRAETVRRPKVVPPAQEAAEAVVVVGGEGGLGRRSLRPHASAVVAARPVASLRISL
mmetsp:Transcript_28206/g.56519  ORF Transcript_28206/g.56519 Transcript_28206/m.56519 type:complete len:220 (+) Transcript_28206:1695-2354(+)